MFCQHCGKEVVENAKFCTSCGKGIADEKIEKRNSAYKSVLVFALFVALGAMGILGYRYYEQQQKFEPEYSLIQLQKALDNQNFKEGKNFVDFDQLMPSVYDDFLAAEEKRWKGDQEDAAWVASHMADLERDRNLNLNGAFRIVLLTFGEPVPDYALDSNIEKRAKGAKELLKQYEPRVKSVQKSNNVAVVAVEFAANQSDLYPQEMEVQFVMEQQLTGHWKVTGVKNLRELLELYRF